MKNFTEEMAKMFQLKYSAEEIKKAYELYCEDYKEKNGCSDGMAIFANFLSDQIHFSCCDCDIYLGRIKISDEIQYSTEELLHAFKSDCIYQEEELDGFSTKSFEDFLKEELENDFFFCKYYKKGY